MPSIISFNNFTSMADITTLIMVLVLLGAFCVPFIYAHQKKKQQEKHLVTSFMAKAKEHQLQIHAYEIWRRTYMIGLDKDTLQLMYIKFHPEMQTRVVDIKKINKVRVINEHRLVGADKQTVIDKLWLLLMHKDQLHPDIHLEFF